MPSFDIVSEYDHQEVRNAVDQASREVANRFDFKGQNPSVDYNESDGTITLQADAEDRVRALQVVMEEKLVKRKVSLKAIEFSQPADAAGGASRIVATLKAGLTPELAKKVNTHIKDLKLKGIQSQTQGDQVRVTAKKRDALQEIIASLREAEFDRPLQFENFRD